MSCGSRTILLLLLYATGNLVLAFPSSAACVDPDLAKIMTGVRVRLCDGSLGEGTLRLCSQDGQANCVTTASHRAADTSSFSGADILVGYTVAGVIGTRGADLARCSSDGEVGCLAYDSFKAADTSNFNAAMVRSGTTIAGRAGSLNNCAADGASSCVTTTTYKAADISSFASSDIVTGTTIAGVVGSATSESHVACTGDGQTGCLATTTYKSANTGAFAASDLKLGRTVAGTAGSLTSCAADGAQTCLTTSAYRAANLGSFAASDLKASVTIAGDTGTIANCASDAGVGCVATTLYKAADTGAFAASDVRSGITIAGVSGSIADCSANGEDSCYINTSTVYDAADLSALSADSIKDGVTIAGVTGLYPSTTYPLANAGAGGALPLTSAAFDARVKGSSVVEWWDEAGGRHTIAGDSDIAAGKILNTATIFGTTGIVYDASGLDPWNTRKGVTIGTVAGNLKMNCRNAINSSVFNSDTSPVGNVGTTTGTSSDWWDTTDDYVANAATMPSTQPSGWSSDHLCNDMSLWLDSTNNGSGDTVCDSAGDDCIYQDRITLLYWSETLSTGATWGAAVQLCNDSTFGGFTDWRLPTIKELSTGLSHGFRVVSLSNSNFIPTATLNAKSYWSGTTQSSDRNDSLSLYLAHGEVYMDPRTNTYSVLCVR